MDGFMAETLTKEDIKKIEAEIEERKLVLRPQLIEAVKEARAQGDLSENFEYYAAKREKNKNESRINYLERMLKFCHVYEDKTNDDEVGIGKEVELYFEDDDESEKFKIVTSIRGDSLKGRLSIESPIGKAIIGRKKGDRVKVAVGNRGYFVKIMSIEINKEDDDIRSF
ncbi:prokaryotic transcription elongation factor, GreA/GreB domain protein [Lachnoanaerobaculum saburreum DSM 3986]|uniref:Transcription elongation factor GreA n=2 Tax=Lachnoanaerobaculum saburreum TaxID=467210 RepID=E6LKG4_9FIRM|nr:prokaryotic transcription elongation factor, GreA/GreB domain protein [Lachnoanaerobaculum saburreum DSM 3986]